MKKLSLALCAFILILTLVGCGGGEPEHTISFVEGKQMLILDEYNCVAVFTQYTNNSSETAIPADNVNVKAYQNGVELPPLVPTGDKTDGYIQCDAGVQSGTTADVVWIFQLEDDSAVTIEMSGSDDIEIEIAG